MESQCNNCGNIYNKTYIEYYKPILTQEFPVCIKCNRCLDCCQFICQCTRCLDCLQIIHWCRCDNDISRYSNPHYVQSPVLRQIHNEFMKTTNNEKMVSSLIDGFDGFQINMKNKKITECFGNMSLFDDDVQ